VMTGSIGSTRLCSVPNSLQSFTMWPQGLYNALKYRVSRIGRVTTKLKLRRVEEATGPDLADAAADL
jgi:hypothetical protein